MHMQIGAACYANKDLAGAREAFAAAAAIQPGFSPALFNLAVVCRDLEQNDEATALLHRVIDQGEILSDAYNNLGILTTRQENYDQAEAYFRKAISLQEHFPLARFNLSTLLLRCGKWEEGWREYEWRWQTPTFQPVQCPQPQWDGAQLDGTLLLHTEQGIGDVFQFARYIPLIRERCRRVIFMCPDNLACMFSSDWADEVRHPGEISLDAFQAILPLLSTPYALGYSAADLPIGEGYLTPEPRHVDLDAFQLPNAKLRVGLTWRGSPTHVNDAFRSMPIQAFEPLLNIPDIAFYSLQVGDAANDLALLGSRPNLFDLNQHQKDFADTAAIVRQLDLVITVDTSLLHLCGGLKHPTWGLLSRRCDWRWQENSQTNTPWYSSVELFRQSTLNDWAELIQRVADRLSQLAGTRPA